ncbi:hypothetical protein D0Z00_001928 [Geotrichum galactomycetum]|uniref:Uncharacterized protein n=1 Tax=Geotrichum galactomycetum TaxID=27317 RepID=A0ACB6V5T1_9ASCO|nr:hypothetical protein D0Z00_001928 [Geotrichum candidum]
MKISALAIAAFISLVSAQAESTVTVHSTHTDLVYSTQIKTITSCSDGKCNKHITSEVVSQSTTYAQPSDFNIDSSVQTITITSCKDNMCSEHVTTTTVSCFPTFYSFEAVTKSESCIESFAYETSSPAPPKVVTKTESCAKSLDYDTLSPAPTKVSTATEECQDCHKTFSASIPSMESSSVLSKPMSSAPTSSSMESGLIILEAISSAPVLSMESAPVVFQNTKCPAPVTVTVTISVSTCAVEPTISGPKPSAAVETTFSTAVASTFAIKF